MTDKDFRKTRLKEIYITLHQRGQPTTLINKGFELTEKKYYKKNYDRPHPAPKKHNNEKTLAYAATYNINNPELFTEVINNLELKK